jgi:hypothetical protein
MASVSGDKDQQECHTNNQPLQKPLSEAQPFFSNANLSS